MADRPERKVCWGCPGELVIPNKHHCVGCGMAICELCAASSEMSIGNLVCGQCIEEDPDYAD